ncbi:MAG: YjbQ family protein [Anaerolineae bacterium]|nr:YjbQ family protein [Anaerolineae bacterium]
MVEQLEIHTPTHTCLVDITSQVQHIVSQTGIKEGLCHIFVPHTTAGLTINENADPTVQSDMLSALDKIVPWRGGYEHAEGNSAAHIKASMLGFSHTVFVVGGSLKLGIWQGVYLAEFDGPRRRRVWIKVMAG